MLGNYRINTDKSQVFFDFFLEITEYFWYNAVKEEDMEIGERIKKFRIRRGLTQEQFAGKMNSAASTISDIERGKRIPRANTLLKIADILEVSVDYLLGRDVINGCGVSKEFLELYDYAVKSGYVSEMSEFFAWLKAEAKRWVLNPRYESEMDLDMTLSEVMIKRKQEITKHVSKLFPKIYELDGDELIILLGMVLKKLELYNPEN